MKKALCIVICLLVIFSCAGCEGGIPLGDVQALTAEYLGYIRAGDYAGAASLFHPTCEDMSADKIEEFTKSVSEGLDIDFSAEPENVRRTGFESALYDSDFKGSVCEVTMRIDIGGEEYTVKTTVVKNDDGYGLYNINFGK